MALERGASHGLLGSRLYLHSAFLRHTCNECNLEIKGCDRSILSFDLEQHACDECIQWALLVVLWWPSSPLHAVLMPCSLVVSMLIDWFAFFWPSGFLICCRVPCPSDFDEAQVAEQCSLDICKGVGHVDCRGGEFPDTEGQFLNQFGQAFQQAGRQWTTGESHLYQ